jgi:uncharacterized protein YbjQ (UPF0145 family)
MSNQAVNPIGLPQVAMSRMDHDREPGAARTHFFNDATFMRFFDMGFEPLVGVVGISVVHLGGLQVAGIRQACELEPYSQAIMMGRRLALARMQQEAATLDADGVFLHQLERRSFHDETEYFAVGSALRFSPRPGLLKTKKGLPFVFSGGQLSLYRMLRRGFVPVAHAYGACVYHVPHQTMRQSLGNSFQNTEVPIFTESWYTARELALSRVQMELEEHGSEIVSVSLPAFDEGGFGEHAANVFVTADGWRRQPEVTTLLGELDLVDATLLDHDLAVWANYPQPRGDQPGSA